MSRSNDNGGRPDRLSSVLSAEITVAGTVLRVVVQNVSAAGLGLTLFAQPGAFADHVGQRVECRVHFAGEVATLRGTMRWSSPDGASAGIDVDSGDGPSLEILASYADSPF